MAKNSKQLVYDLFKWVCLDEEASTQVYNTYIYMLVHTTTFSGDHNGLFHPKPE